MGPISNPTDAPLFPVKVRPASTIGKCTGLLVLILYTDEDLELLENYRKYDNQ